MCEVVKRSLAGVVLQNTLHALLWVMRRAHSVAIAAQAQAKKKRVQRRLALEISFSEGKPSQLLNHKLTGSCVFRRTPMKLSRSPLLGHCKS